MSRKYCNTCKKKIPLRLLEQHKTICKKRMSGELVSILCDQCYKMHDCSYGAGIYCSSECALKSRKKQKCNSCNRLISICNYASHTKKCQGPKFNIEQWNVGENKYQCPECAEVFPKLGISSHYTKIHGPITRDLINTNIEIILSEPAIKLTNCQCGSILTGKQKKFCSKKCKLKSPKIKANDYASQKRRAKRRKIQLIMHMGGKCEECGYKRNIAGLCFHHIIQEQKDFKLDARQISNRSFDVLHKEAAKCKLLCHNCHMETHYPDLNNLF